MQHIICYTKISWRVKSLSLKFSENDILRLYDIVNETVYQLEKQIDDEYETKYSRMDHVKFVEDSL